MEQARGEGKEREQKDMQETSQIGEWSETDREVLALQLCPRLVISYAHTPTSPCFPCQSPVIFLVTISQCWASLFRAYNPLNTPQVVIFVIFDPLVHGLPPWALALFHPQYYLECIYNCVWHSQCLFTVCIWVYIITSKCISLVPALVHFHDATAMTTMSNDASCAIGCICLYIRLCLRWPRSSLEPVSFLVSASPLPCIALPWHSDELSYHSGAIPHY